MHITSFKIFNFRSYRHYILREKLSPGVNIFIGYNGSGKTTLFQAIDYIFNFKKKNFKYFDTLNNKNKYFDNQKFFSMVEISFDNSDRFFPVPSNEINIRRIFGSNIDKFLLCNCNVLPNHFFDFLNLKKVYLDNLVFKIKQGMHLEFKNASPKKRLQIFTYSIGLSCFKLFEKKSIEYLLKINLFKKKLLNLIEKVKKKEKYFSNKLKKYKRNENFTNEILILIFIYIQTRLKIFEKKKNKATNNHIQSFNTFQIIYTRFFFFKEEDFYIKYKSNFKKFKKFKKKNDYFLYMSKCLKSKNRFILFNNLIINYFAYVILKLESVNNLFEKLNKHFDNIKNRAINTFKIYNLTIKKNNDNENYKAIFLFNQYLLYRKIYKILHSFRIRNFDYATIGSISYFFIEEIIDKLKFSKLKVLKFENKIFSFFQEISTEKEKVRMNLFKFENELEYKLGTKNLKGVKKLLEIYKTTEYLKFKIYGLVIDLILVHKHFYIPVENLLNKYFTHIVVKDRNTILKIIKIYKEKIKIKIDFITLLGRSNFNNSKKKQLFKNIFPILLTIYYRPIFNTLFKRLLFNIYFINNQTSKNLFYKYGFQIINLDGDIFYPDGYITLGLLNRTKTTLELVNSIKRNRFFFIWLKKFNEKILKLMKFLSFLKNKIEFVYKFLEKFLKLISLKNTFDILHIQKLTKYEFFFWKTIKKENIYVSKFQNKKSYKFFAKKFCINIFDSDKIIKKNNFWNLYNIFFLKKLRLNEQMNLFSINIYYKILKNVNKKFFHLSNNYQQKIYLSKKKFIILSKKTYFYFSVFFFFRLFFKKIIFTGFYLKNLVSICFFYKKNINFSKTDILNFTIKIKKSEIRKKLLRIYYKISIKKINLKQNQKLNNFFFLRKIFTKSIIKFNQFETDLSLVNQTFDILIRKKKEKIKNFLIRVSKNFSFTFNKYVLNGKAAIIVKYNIKYLTNLNKLYQNINIVGISILAKFTNINSICFLEQMSSGQGSIISFFFYISMRIINFVLIYIIDEFDANLDFDNSIIFSYIIKEISTFGIQFLLSTFSAKSILNGDKWFGISVTTKGSYIQNVSKTTALKFNKIRKKMNN
jgi:predicted ATPase